MDGGTANVSHISPKTASYKHVLGLVLAAAPPLLPAGAGAQVRLGAAGGAGLCRQDHPAQPAQDGALLVLGAHRHRHRGGGEGGHGRGDPAADGLRPGRAQAAEEGLEGLLPGGGRRGIHAR